VRVGDRGDLPPKLLAKLRSICLRLPEAREEPAWVGIRWVIRKRNFAHVLEIDRGWPPAYARAAASDGPLIVVTFRTSDAMYTTFADAGQRFFQAEWGTRWGTHVVGMRLDGRVNWEEVELLLVESYRLLAPKRLASENAGLIGSGSPPRAGPAKRARTRATRGGSPKSTREARRSASSRRSRTGRRAS
jgi:hypothetical protein